VFKNRKRLRKFMASPSSVEDSCFIACNAAYSALHQTLFGRSNEEERDGWRMRYVLETQEVHTGFWWENLRKRDHLKDRGVDGRIML
jgi:hypothetical protein